MIRSATRASARSVAKAVVGRLPVPVADAVRWPLPHGTASPGRLRRVMLRALREGGIPRAVSTFRLVDNPDLTFVAADSLGTSTAALVTLLLPPLPVGARARRQRRVLDRAGPGRRPLYDRFAATAGSLRRQVRSDS
jgi:hypothetical protein